MLAIASAVGPSTYLPTYLPTYLLICLLALTASADTHYVDINSTNPVSPYTNWPTASTDIQSAIDMAISNDTVLVTNGVYSTGGRAYYGAMTNRVTIERSVKVQSVNGPAVTIIRGNGPIGDGAVRCAYVGTNCVLSGFTLTNGATRTNGHLNFEQCGGGVLACDGSLVSNCVIVANSAYADGGGSYIWKGAALYRCDISRNTAQNGGGARAATQPAWLYSCTLSTNTASNGGGAGAMQCILVACTVSGNSAVVWGGGAMWSTLTNCIVYYNSAPTGPNYYTNGSPSKLAHCCTTPDPGGIGNITNAPQFVNAAAGNYRLLSNSPCINAGTNQDWMTNAVDLGGLPRVIGGIVDMGAYESTNGTTTNGVPWGWLVHYGLASDGSGDTGYADGDTMNNLQEYLAGTDPINAASVFQMDQFYPDGTSMVVSWSTLTDRIYRVEVTPTLMPPAWTAVPNWSNVPGTLGGLCFTNSSAATNEFYRLKVRLAP